MTTHPLLSPLTRPGPPGGAGMVGWLALAGLVAFGLWLLYRLWEASRRL